MNSLQRALRLAVLAPWWLGAMAASPPREKPARDHLVEVENFNPRLLAREIFRESNEVRVRHGVVSFKLEARLVAAAEEQAAMQAIRIHSGHDSPLTNHGDPTARVEQAGLPPGTVAENAATLNVKNRETGHAYTYAELATVIVQAWMDSPGHRANLLSRQLVFLGCGTRAAYLLQGQGVVYAIQDFYAPASRRPEPIEVPATEIPPGGPHLTR